MGKQDGWTFIHSEAKDAVWEKGLREILSYRYLGTDAGTNGAYVAQVIRNTGKDQKEIHEDCERNKWLDPKEMVEYGLVDKVLSQLPTSK